MLGTASSPKSGEATVRSWPPELVSLPRATCVVGTDVASPAPFKAWEITLLPPTLLSRSLSCDAWLDKYLFLTRSGILSVERERERYIFVYKLYIYIYINHIYIYKNQIYLYICICKHRTWGRILHVMHIYIYLFIYMYIHIYIICISVQVVTMKNTKQF